MMLFSWFQFTFLKELHAEMKSPFSIVYDMDAGGTFVLYSLLCRHAKVGLLPNNCDADDALLAYEMGRFYKNNSDTKHKWTIEKSKQSRYLMLMVALLGSCMVIGNGVLVPAISGLNIFLKFCHMDISLTDQTMNLYISFCDF